jgi:ElaB/YqjD/DUF883 family membrane-anchored ribosome-binding protein
MTDGDELRTTGLFESGIPDDDIFANTPRRAAGLGRTVTDFIVEHPEICLGLALAVGVAVGVVVKRK